MKNHRRFLIIIVSLVFMLAITSAFAETSENYSFRNGITFGMKKDFIAQIESENNQVQPDEWYPTSWGQWEILIAAEKVQVSKYSAQLAYFFSANQMEILAYDFQEGATDTMYNDISAALSALYGEAQSIPAEAFLPFARSCFIDCPWTEEDIRSCLAWETEYVKIYQYYYGPDSFGILYANPEWDYTPKETPTPAETETPAPADLTGL